MDDQEQNAVEPIEASPDPLVQREGDSQSTRREKEFLRNLRRDQKLSLAAFVLLLLVVPLTMAAVYGPTRLYPQASQPKPSPLPFDVTPTPTPVPYPNDNNGSTVVPAP